MKSVSSRFISSYGITGRCRNYFQTPKKNSSVAGQRTMRYPSLAPLQHSSITSTHRAPIYKKCSPTYQTPITSFANGTSSAAKIGTQTSARILTPKNNAESGCTIDDGGKEVTKSLCFAERLGEERGREVLYPKVCLMLLT